MSEFTSKQQYDMSGRIIVPSANLYPVLENPPTAPTIDPQGRSGTIERSGVTDELGYASMDELGRAGHSFRLEKIDKIQKEIDQEREHRLKMSKKYHRAIRIVQIFDEAMIILTMGLGVAGIGVLSTVVAAPLAIAMEASALGVGFLSLIGSQISKRLSLKAEKHDKIKALAEAKLNTISDHISRALRDGVISDDEYRNILDELEKFKVLKEETRSNIRVGIDEATKQSLIEQGKKETMTSFQKMFAKGRASFRDKSE